MDGPGNPLACSRCGREIGPAEARSSYREYDRYLCLPCMDAIANEEKGA